MELKKYDLLTNSCIGRQEVKGNKYAFITVVSYYQINIKCQYQLFSVFRKLRKKTICVAFSCTSSLYQRDTNMRKSVFMSKPSKLDFKNMNMTLMTLKLRLVNAHI